MGCGRSDCIPDVAVIGLAYKGTANDVGTLPIGYIEPPVD